MTVDFERMYWVDYPSRATPINAANLNRLEEGVAGLYSDMSKGVLYFTNVSVLANSGTIVTVSNGKITSDHVVVSAVFAAPSNITTDVNWTTANGSLTMSGTCSGATTVNLVLAQKQN